MVRKDEIDGELRRDRRLSLWTWLHKGEWGLGWVHVWDHFLPCLREGFVTRRDVGGEGPKWTPSGDGTGEEASGGLA